MADAQKVNSSMTDHEIDALLGPVGDRHDVAAVAARQDHLSALAHAAGEATLNVLAHAKGWQDRGVPFDRQGVVVSAFVDDMVRLDKAMRAYTHETGRPDVLDVVLRAVEFAAGDKVATVVMGLLEGVRRELPHAVSDI